MRNPEHNSGALFLNKPFLPISSQVPITKSVRISPAGLAVLDDKKQVIDINLVVALRTSTTYIYVIMFSFCLVF